ncbi:MAG TPA: KpsF/GutQ family sugar-phosphate isomerase [Microvirga sp.]|nr:KpsF/GutQ family sugar-phosphate isomerase [Microvirga sp.]
MGFAQPKADLDRQAVASAIRTLATEREGLVTLMDAIGNGLGDRFAAAVERIAAAQGRTIVTGIGKSGHVARKIAATLASTGTPSHYVHPAEASHGDLGMVRPEDVILALSWSGETTELADIIAYAKRFRVPLIAVTSNDGSTLGRQADVCLAIPKAREACPNGLAPTTSTTMQLALGDALAVALLERRGFTADHFRVLHPGGKLGAQLKHVRDIMHTGERLPIVPTGTLMADALVVQSEKSFGCTIVVDRDGDLAGIVTDGDVRRHMSDRLLARTVDEVMTRTPLTIAPDLLVAEALDLVETHKKSALIIAEGRRPVGLVHVLDLLRVGAA